MLTIAYRSARSSAVLTASIPANTAGEAHLRLVSLGSRGMLGTRRPRAATPHASVRRALRTPRSHHVDQREGGGPLGVLCRGASGRCRMGIVFSDRPATETPAAVCRAAHLGGARQRRAWLARRRKP